METTTKEALVRKGTAQLPTPQGDNGQYYIPKHSIPSLENAIAKLNRRAAKIGVDPIVCNVTDAPLIEYWYQVTRQGDFDEYTQNRLVESDLHMAQLVTVHVSGDSPIINGWQFVAAIEHQDGVNLIHGIKAMIPLSYSTAKPVCEHCQQNRARNNTYVLRSEQGEHKQVGSSCLKDFTGHNSPESIAMWFAAIQTFFADFCDFEESDNLGTNGNTQMLDLAKVLVVAELLTRANGYTSKGKASMEGKVSTAESVIDVLTARNASQSMVQMRADVDAIMEAVC